MAGTPIPAMAASLRTPIPAAYPSTGSLLPPSHLPSCASSTPSHSPRTLHPFPKKPIPLYHCNCPDLCASTILQLPPFRLEVLDFCSFDGNDPENANEWDNPEGFMLAYSLLPVMKQEYDAFGGATLEKSKLNLSQTTTQVPPQTEGGGGDVGNRINHGRGDGGDDGGDDDDYFEDGHDNGDGDDGEFFQRRLVLPEIFDRKDVEAFLQEWYKTMSDLPAGSKQTMQLGFVRYISKFGRSTLARLLSLAMPLSTSRGLIGRMIADPGFLSKMCWEQSVTAALGIWWEVKHRKMKIKDEWHSAALNVLAVCLCNVVIVWSLAPCRSYGSIFKFDLHNTIQKLPNNVFERNYVFREFNALKRVQGLFYKAGELCLAGSLIGGAVGSITRSAASNNVSSSMAIPAVETCALAYGAFLGLSGNLRYQLLLGTESMMQQHFHSVGTVTLFSALLRVLNIYVGDAIRVSWLGLDGKLERQIEAIRRPYHRPAASEKNPFLNLFPLNSFSQLRLLRNQKPSIVRRTTKQRAKKKVMVAG